MNSIHPNGSVTSDCAYCEWESEPQHTVSDAMGAATEHMARCMARDTYFVSLRFPIGSSITTDIHSIGDRVERVTGKVVGHKRRGITVQTEWHGTLHVEPSKVIGDAA